MPNVVLRRLAFDCSSALSILNAKPKGPQRNRRQLFLVASAAVTLNGCGPSSVTQPLERTVDDAVGDFQEVVSDASTEDLERYKVALRGYQIVSFYVAGRAVFLPYPGMRILSVALVVTSVAAKLAVEYIDDELNLRKIEESITDKERAAIESKGYIEFNTDSGRTEKTFLAPTTYVKD